MKLIFSSDIIDFFDDIAHFFDDIIHFFKYDEIDIISDMIICIEYFKKNILIKNEIDESIFKRKTLYN